MKALQSARNSRDGSVRNRKPSWHRGLIVLAVTGLIALTAGCTPASTATVPEAQTSQATEGAATEGAGAAWSPSADCGPCHERAEASQGDDRCLAAPHGDVPCATCHSDEALADVHEDATAEGGAKATRLKKTVIDTAACIGCHGEAVELAALTAETTACTDKNGLVVNPHDLPTNVEHEDIDCDSCHIMHDERTAAEQAESLCTSCHHENVYECFTCHA